MHVAYWRVAHLCAANFHFAYLSVALSLHPVMHAASILYFYSKPKGRGRSGSKNKGKKLVRRAIPKKSCYTVPLLGGDGSTPAHYISTYSKEKYSIAGIYRIGIP